MRTVRQALLAALALILIGGPTSAARAQQERSGAVAGGEMLRIDFESRAPLSQGDTAGCGPVSLLNLLKLGDPAYRRAYAAIAAGDDRQALGRLAARYCSADGAAGTIRYSDETGINDANLSRLCEAVAGDFELGGIETLYANRRRGGESNRLFAERINRPLVHSVRTGAGVIISIDSYAVRSGEWEKLTGHYLLLTGVQPLGEANPASFLIEMIDPVGGQRRQALVYASDHRESRALAHFPDGDQWLEGNPYLYVAAPSLDLRESRQADDVRHAYFLTIVFGRLGLGE